MTKHTVRTRKGTLVRKLKEQALARDRGSHQRWQHTRDTPGAGIKTRLVCDKAAAGELHLLSQAELAEFLEGWCRRDVKVILDQVALACLGSSRGDTACRKSISSFVSWAVRLVARICCADYSIALWCSAEASSRELRGDKLK
ncbi:hypothetical protein [Paraburkholderia youngii]|uniref:Uncharacterized protein n=1 Tax=Paraburkholderia youngii TaxID=2782701 RepID=A0A7Y6JV23_9BURK|nr:hypothetical protein [Paraburkholderia youngii]NUX98888.1 hypothetical protein [Paraburkholderia youngii]